MSRPEHASPQERLVLCQRVFVAMTAIMDEETALDDTPARNNFLADCGDLRAPLGLALANLIGFERGRHPELRASFLRMHERSSAALSRLECSVDLMTVTQLAAFAAVRADCGHLLPGMRAAIDQHAPSGSARLEPSFVIATTMFEALNEMIDIERERIDRADRKPVIAAIVEVRGPLGLAVSHLQDFADTLDPASRRLFAQTSDRIELGMAALMATSGELCAVQLRHLATVRVEWERFPDEARATMRNSSPPNRASDKVLHTCVLALLLLATPYLVRAVSAFIASGDIENLLGEIALIAIAFAAALLFLRVRVAAPLRQFARRIDGLSRCEDLHTAIPDTLLSHLSGPLDRLRLTLCDADSTLSDAVASARSQTIERRQSMLRVAEAFDHSISHFVTSLAGSSDKMIATAEEMMGLATRTSSRSAQVAHGSRNASRNVETLATTAGQLSTTVSEIARKSDEVAGLSSEAAARAAKVQTAMDELHASVAAIGDVAGLIATVANHTNLLALNATIEAAHAGDAGRGFTVVATEVKSLALQTEAMTGHIMAHLANIRMSSAEAGSTFTEISERIDSIAAATQAIAVSADYGDRATREIAISAGLAATGTGEVAANVTAIESSSGDTRVAADHVLAAASDLTRQSKHLLGEVGRFLATVKAA